MITTASIDTFTIIGGVEKFEEFSSECVTE
jgi:hypothetical protein